MLVPSSISNFVCQSYQEPSGTRAAMTAKPQINTKETRAFRANILFFYAQLTKIYQELTRQTTFKHLTTAKMTPPSWNIYLPIYL